MLISLKPRDCALALETRGKAGGTDIDDPAYTILFRTLFEQWQEFLSEGEDTLDVESEKLCESLVGIGVDTISPSRARVVHLSLSDQPEPFWFSVRSFDVPRYGGLQYRISAQDLRFWIRRELLELERGLTSLPLAELQDQAFTLFIPGEIGRYSYTRSWTRGRESLGRVLASRS